MRHLLFLPLALAAPVRLIIDTDLGGGGCNDVDDVVAICAANALENLGEARLLAVLQNTAPVKVAGAVSVLNTFYGRGDIPIGAYDINTKGATLKQQEPLPFVEELVAAFPSKIKSSEEAEDAVRLYRRTLAAQPDGSVVISSIGIHTNLAALLRSGGDEHSELDGVELVKGKVALLAVMGGRYPEGGECNLRGGIANSSAWNRRTGAAASRFVAETWPGRIRWLGLEVGFQVESGGRGFQERCPELAKRSPCAAAMVSYEGARNKGRFSWDPLSTLAAVRGLEAVAMRESEMGRNVLNETSGNRWLEGQGQQHYVVLEDAKKAGDALDELLCVAPLEAKRLVL